MNAQNTKRLAVAALAVGLTLGGSTAAGATTATRPAVERPDAGGGSEHAGVVMHMSLVVKSTAPVGTHAGPMGVGFERPE
jgi:hypothetical protein